MGYLVGAEPLTSTLLMTALSAGARLIRVALFISSSTSCLEQLLFFAYSSTSMSKFICLAGVCPLMPGSAHCAGVCSLVPYYFVWCCCCLLDVVLTGRSSSCRPESCEIPFGKSNNSGGRYARKSLGKSFLLSRQK